MKKKIIALFLASAMALSMAACGSKAPASSASGAGSAAAGQKAAAPDQDLVIGFNLDISTLDPHQVADTLSMSVQSTMYEPLVTFDENQKIVPALAESWKAESDNLTYTFKLRKGVKFHDGTEFNAAAFKANYDRCMKDQKLRQYRTVSKWQSVETPDDYTVVIKLKEPNCTFINKMTMFEIISPKALAQGAAYLAKNPDGTGAYQFKERVEGDHVTVTPFAGYWNGKPAVNSITFKAVPEDGARVAMLQTGEADYIYPMPSTQAPTVDGKKDIKVITSPSAIMRYVTLNTNLPQLKDKRVRQAMNYAIDKKAYIKTIFNGYASEVHSCYPSTVQYYSEQTPYDFNLEKAKSLMKEAGYENGFELTMWGDNTTNEMKGMQFVEQQLAQIGIKVKVTPMEPNTLSSMISVEPDKAKVQTWYVNWSPSSFDADGAVRSILAYSMIPPTSANTAYYNNPEFDKTLDEALAATDTAKLTDLYAKAQKLVWEDAPWIFLGSDQVIAGEKTYVSGIYLAPDGKLDVTKAKLS